MRINLSAPEGNTFAALGIATRLMREARRDAAEIVALRKAVMSAKSPEEARAAITKATYGCIEFYEGEEDDQ
jgi:thiamine monophosphate synthase